MKNTKKILLLVTSVLLIGVGLYFYNNSNTNISTQSADAIWTEESLLAAASQAEFAISEMELKIQKAKDDIDAESDEAIKSFYQKKFDKNIKEWNSIISKNQATVDRLKEEAAILLVDLPVATAKPEAAKPEAAKPEAAKPEAAKPEAAKPEAERTIIDYDFTTQEYPTLELKVN